MNKTLNPEIFTGIEGQERLVNTLSTTIKGCEEEISAGGEGSEGIELRIRNQEGVYITPLFYFPQKMLKY